jgi:uncharacterized protein YchJ
VGDKLETYLRAKTEKEQLTQMQYKECSRKTRTASKRRYNEKNYASIHVHLEKDLVHEFRRVCKENGVSQSKVIREAVNRFVYGSTVNRKQGRNIPCLCGSGKKYKHCCLGR